MRLKDYLADTTQTELARKVEVSRPLITQIANGMPAGFETAFKIRCATGGAVSYEDLEEILLEARPDLRRFLAMLPASKRPQALAKAA